MPSKSLRNLGTKKGLRRYYSTQSLGIRQRPILPGRFQPSTFSAERLNFCVRYGYRWFPLAIATGNCMLFSSSFALRFFALLAPSFPENCTDPFPLRFPCLRFRLTYGFRFLALRFFHTLLRLLLFLENSLRSSPRPISISKLHMLPHFHR